MDTSNFTDSKHGKSVAIYDNLSDTISRLIGLESILRNSYGAVDDDANNIFLVLADVTARITQDVCNAADYFDQLKVYDTAAQNS